MRSAESKRLDMLHGPIWSKLPQFALPVAATAILEQLFNASDIAVVGNFTGADKTIAVAAVGANSALIALIVNLFIGIALGANVVIANAVGRGDREAVQKAVHTSIVFSLLGGIVVAVLGELAAAALLHVPDDVFPQALLYLRIYLMGMPVILLYNFEAAIFRSVGETRVPLVALAMSGVLNVLLNLFFVAVLHMTVNGVAIATVMANAFSSAPVPPPAALRQGHPPRAAQPAHGRPQPVDDPAHRPSRRAAERGVRHFQHCHSVRHQQPRQGRYGSLERRLQHRGLRL